MYNPVTDDLRIELTGRKLVVTREYSVQLSRINTSQTE